MASALMPKVGIVHECSTSAAVIMIRMSVWVGKITRLSVSSRRKESGFISVVGII